MENGTYSKQDHRKNIVHCHIILLSNENMLRSENISYYVFLNFPGLLEWNLLCYKHSNGYDVSKQTDRPHNAKQNTLAPILAFHPAGCEFLLHLSSIHNWTAVKVAPLCWRSVGHCYRWFNFSWRTIHFWNYDISGFTVFLVKRDLLGHV